MTWVLYIYFSPLIITAASEQALSEAAGDDGEEGEAKAEVR